MPGDGIGARISAGKIMIEYWFHEYMPLPQWVDYNKYNYGVDDHSCQF